MLRASALVLPLLLTACDPPVVGFWESDDKLGNGDRNELDVYSDNTAEAKIYATATTMSEDWITFKFDAEWTDGGFQFDMDMECKSGPCDGGVNDFKMECEVIEQADGVEKMDCKGDGMWSDYPFDWQRNE